MSLVQKIKQLYLKNVYFKYTVQFIFLLLIYFSVRTWQSKNNISGAAPIILSSTLNGETFDLSAKQSRPVLVHFWATWCPVCQFENSNIDNIAKDYQVITVASWSGDAEKVMAFVNKENLTFPVVLDEDGEWAKVYGVNAVPISFIVDSKGNIQFVERGYSSEWGLRLRLWWLE